MAVGPPRPLSEGDDRHTFDCGRESMNLWFRRHAWQNHVNGISRVSVLSDTASGQIVGYVTLSATQIERAFLPKPAQRNRPDPIPAILLGQLAIDLHHQGQGHAASLLQFALRTVLAITEIVGGLGVLTHPLDDGVREFYRRWGFVDLLADPRRSMFVHMVDLKRAFGLE